MTTRADELTWLAWFYDHADFGPADDDVRLILMEEFECETGMRPPLEYDTASDYEGDGDEECDEGYGGGHDE